MISIESAQSVKLCQKNAQNVVLNEKPELSLAPYMAEARKWEYIKPQPFHAGSG